MKSYRVKNGVLWCAGKRVPADRIVMLTRAQALHAPVDAITPALPEGQQPSPQPSAKPSPKPRRRAITPPDLGDDDLGRNAPKGDAR